MEERKKYEQLLRGHGYLALFRDRYRRAMEDAKVYDLVVELQRSEECSLEEAIGIMAERVQVSRSSIKRARDRARLRKEVTTEW